MIDFKMRPVQMRLTPRLLKQGSALLLLAAATATLAGCGGGSSNTNAARVRAVDAAAEAGTANILINGASANGDQQALSQTSASPYLYLSGDRQSSFSFNTTIATPPGLLAPATPNLNLSNGQFYTAFLVGRADVAPVTVPGTKTVNDPRFLQVVVTKDSHDAPASGSALVRVVDAAPDGGAVDVVVNGSVLSGYSNVSFQKPVTDFLAVPYVNVPAGNLSVVLRAAGTANSLFAPASISLSAGHTYTLLFVEPTIGTAAATGIAATAPTFGLQTIEDNG